MTPTLNLSGRKTLITGGAQGIGEATARLFMALGASVVIADRNAEALAVAGAALGVSGTATGNVAAEDDVAAMIALAREKLGGLDTVINCAGIGGDFRPTVEQDLKSWQRIVDVNLRGTFLVCREAGRHMLTADGGVIVNFSSLTGVGGFPRRNAYGAAKAGVAMMTQSLACEWGNAGIRVNCIVPGYIRTPTVAQWADGNTLDAGRIIERTPMRRWGKPEEIANVVAFLASDWATFINGVVLPVDGGWTAFGGAGEVASA